MTSKTLGLLACLLLTGAIANARPDGPEETPAFSNVPELTAAFHLLYSQRFPKLAPLSQRLFRELNEEFLEGTLYVVEYAKAMGRPVLTSMHR